jgi:hypothetical protein
MFRTFMAGGYAERYTERYTESYTERRMYLVKRFLNEFNLSN